MDLADQWPISGVHRQHHWSFGYCGHMVQTSSWNHNLRWGLHGANDAHQFAKHYLDRHQRGGSHQIRFGHDRIGADDWDYTESNLYFPDEWTIDSAERHCDRNYQYGRQLVPFTSSGNVIERSLYGALSDSVGGNRNCHGNQPGVHGRRRQRDAQPFSSVDFRLALIRDSDFWSVNNTQSHRERHQQHWSELDRNTRGGYRYQWCLHSAGASDDGPVGNCQSDQRS